MKSIAVLGGVFLISMGVASLRMMHQTYNYYVFQVTSFASPRDIGVYFDAEYLRTVADMPDYLLFRRLKERDEHGGRHVMGEYRRLQIAANAVYSRRNRTEVKLAKSIFGIEKQVPYAVTHYDISDGLSDAAHRLNKRNILLRNQISDPLFKKQWHLKNNIGRGGDMNVMALWEKGFTGEGVTVAVADDGVDFKHRDLKSNYSPRSSYDFVEEVLDASPKLSIDTHGTACAGLVAASYGDVCGVGVAPSAKIASLRMLSTEMTSSLESSALTHQNQINAIYSNSWTRRGEQDEVFVLQKVALAAYAKGASEGRGGRGSIFVFSSGNRAREGFNCGYKPESNIPETITIGAVDEDDLILNYSEGCPAVIATAYSSRAYNRNIVTSTAFNDACRSNFSGTSASAPMASGLIAIMLQIRPDLSWRDVQHVIVNSARPVDVLHPSWKKIYNQRLFSHRYGFGVLDGVRMHAFLQTYKTVPPQRTLFTGVHHPSIEISSKASAEYTIQVARQENDMNELQFIEHVVVTVTIHHGRRKDLTIEIISPSGFRSVALRPRPEDTSPDGYVDYPIKTLAHWDEPPAGKWTIVVNGQPNSPYIGTFVSCSLKFYGRSKPIASVLKQVRTTKPPYLPRDEL